MTTQHINKVPTEVTTMNDQVIFDIVSSTILLKILINVYPDLPWHTEFRGVADQLLAQSMKLT